MPEEHFDLPTLTINLRDGGGAKSQMVGEQHQHLLVWLAPDLDAAQGRYLPVVMAAQLNDFILANVAILRNRTLFQDAIVGIVAHAGDEEYALLGQSLIPLVIHVAAVENHDRAWRKAAVPGDFYF